jgi:hypothetical protein
MRYTIDIDSFGFTAYRGGSTYQPRKSERIATSAMAYDLLKLFNEIIRESGVTTRAVQFVGAAAAPVEAIDAPNAPSR